MASLEEDIRKQSAWIIKAFEADNYKLDYSIHSLIEIDRFLEENMKDGRPKRKGRLATNFGAILFSISGYVATTLIKNVPGSILITDDSDPKGELNFSVQFPSGGICWPAQKVFKRVQNGIEDGIYPYGYELTKEFITEKFDSSFWEIGKGTDTKPESKPWWRFW